MVSRRAGAHSAMIAAFPIAQNTHGPIRLHDAARRQGRAAQAPDSQGHFAVVLSRRQDRRAGAQRLGQIEPAEDHGGRGQELRRRGGPDAQHAHRLPAAGAAARSGQDRARNGRGGARRNQRGEKEARRNLRGLRRARCRLRQARHRSGQVRGGHRGGGRRHRAPARNRRRRAAPAAVGREDQAAVGRREAPRRAVPPVAVQARHAAARRADQPPRRRKRRVARAVPAEISRHRRRRDARSLLSRQRGGMDTRTRPRPRHPVERQLQLVARAEGRAPDAGRSDRVGAPEDDQARTRVGAAEREGTPGEEQGAARALRGTVFARIPEAQRDAGNFHSGRRPPRRQRDRIQGREQRLRRPPADRRSLVRGAARRDRRHHRAQRRRQVDALSHDHRQGKTRQGRSRDRQER